MPLLAALDLTAHAILGAVANSMRDGSANVLDRSFRYLYASGPGLARVGLTPATLIGRTLYDLYPAAEVAMVEPYYRRALSGERVTFDLPVFGHVYEIAASPLTPDTILVLVQDVTDRRDVEAQHEQQDRLVTVVAHEIRQPLGPLRIALELMQRRAADARRYVPVIQRQLRHLERLVADLGDVAQLGVGHFDLRMDDLDLTNIVATVVEDAEQEFGRAFVWAPSGSVFVRGDEGRLYQVFANLLSNAVRHTPGTGVIEVRLRQDDATATVVVTDSGGGIPRDLLPRLFDPFVQGSGPKGRMGLGLHLVRAIVDHHKGSVEAFSDGPGQGSRFVVTLPVSGQSASGDSGATDSL